VLAGVGYVGYRVLSNGDSPVSLLTGPEEVFNERIGLKEGQAKNYIFELSDARRIEVTVEASPKPVNVYLMNDGDLAAYSKAREKNKRNFTYREELSNWNVLHMKRSASLPAGNWHMVVERPREALLLGEHTSVTVRVMAY
jgi:hypothetical protein